MDQVLGRPSVDPHGDPIPSAKGKVDEARYSSLADCPLNRAYRITRVIDQDPAFLQFVDRCGLMPGVNVTVEVRDALADAVWVRPKDRRPLTLGTTAAAKILVENA
jgi:DtxR family Mn-dependent transcriptional regulator